MKSNDDKIKIPEILYYSYYTLGSSTASPYHSHSYYEFTYLYECEGLYYIDGKKIKVNKGDIILFPPGCKHGELILEGQQFNIFVVGLEGFDFFHIPGFYCNFGGSTPFIDAGSYNTAITDCCEEIRQEILCCNLGYRSVIKGLIEKLIVLLIRSKTSTTAISTESNEQVSIDYSDKRDIVAKIKHYIDFYYSSRISLEDIAHNVYLSPAYVIRIFKEETGETPINYLIKVRMDKARELLTEGKASIDEVVERVGYTDAIHFSKMFKKHTGFSPAQFCKNHKVSLDK